MTSRIQSATPGEHQGEQATGQAPYPTGAASVSGRQNGREAPASLDELHETARRIAANVERVLVGKPDVIRIALVTLLAEGHLLVEDVPGVGKTSLAKALARSIDCTVSRIQFTPDLLPSDVTGVSIYNRQSGEFEFRPGPVFANIVVGDEINRASPKTQSALLECMEEHQVTVDTSTYHLEEPFMVIATQNPIEMEGTYALPEAQRDRFTARVSIGYPDQQAELAMVDEHAGHNPLADLEPVSDRESVQRLIETVRSVHMSPEIRRYAVDLVAATRQMPEIRLGASPRATLQLVRAARAQAALSGREFVVPDDLHTVAVPVLAHRMVLTTEAHAARRSATDVVRAILHRVPVPQGSNHR
ncbi:AAA family ATPase [Amycolatopsis keratiniphila]|uniref:ATPase n=1 Tax=Amycolatopsis keratiniphila subsp. keratiniphila TaxID=227715 RepID=A0A1W2LX62_9PSEU|nr:MoxR family ATPase [Amycolatopsis keratiniphila]OLZ48532.1 ATPase [Amycolatopsis keratiniphila subsp. nogabecina]ONF71486.1 ATPase [Amycolatopsis keratiniphila subsp. keratiniphila]SDU37196.1 MoxR-like ATPase [Amycolatopsis keratiniphila]